MMNEENTLELEPSVIEKLKEKTKRFLSCIEEDDWEEVTVDDVIYDINYGIYDDTAFVTAYKTTSDIPSGGYRSTDTSKWCTLYLEKYSPEYK